jgi:phospholipase C
MFSDWNADFSSPEVVVGVAGIYDLRLLRNQNSHPTYQEFLVAAFGDEESMWDLASPARQPFPPWKVGKLIVLVTSSGDELVDPTQIDVMARTLETYDYNNRDIKAEVWKEGVGLGEIIGRTLREFFSDAERDIAS